MWDGWVTCRLGDLMDRTTDRLGDASEPTILTCTENHGLVDQIEHMGRRRATDDVSSYKVVEPLDVVYNVYLLWLGAIGQNLTGALGVTSPAYEVFRPSPAIYGPFLGLLLRSPALLDHFNMISIGTVPRRRRAPWQDFLDVTVTIPSLAEQQCIVDLIGSLDDAIEAAEESAGALDHAYLALLERVNNSGFELRRLESALSKAKAGGTPSRRVPKNYGGSIPWLKSGEVENDSIITSSESITEFALATSSAWLAPAGATVVAMYGQGDTKGKAGFLLVPVAMNQAVIALVPNEEIIDGRFLFHVMRSRTVSLRKKAVGAAQPNLSKGIVVDEEIPLPPLGAQAGISSMLDSALDSRRLAEMHAFSLRNLRTNLLTALLSGTHEIPESYDDQLLEAV